MTTTTMLARRAWRRSAGVAVIMAILTGLAFAAVGATQWHAWGAAVYVGVAAATLFSPGAIAVQVIGGVLMTGSLLRGPDALHPLMLLPLVAGVIATAELLALATRLDTTVEREPGDGFARAGRAILIGAGVFAMVVFAGGVPAPGGLVAIFLASAACVGLAVLLVRGPGSQY